MADTLKAPINDHWRCPVCGGEYALKYVRRCRGSAGGRGDNLLDGWALSMAPPHDPMEAPSSVPHLGDGKP